MNEAKDRGVVIVNTGNGKGKTTAAFGQALRAAGHGMKVLIIQFLKGNSETGEVKAVRQFLPNVSVVQMGLPRFIKKSGPTDADKLKTEEGLRLAMESVRSTEYDMVILDELNVAVHYGLVSEDEVAALIKQKRPGLNLVITGRYAPQSVIDLADIVSEIKEIKHYYEEGYGAQKGIEF